MTDKKQETRNKMLEEKTKKKKAKESKEMRELRKELETKEKEAQEYLDMLKRLKAEFENYKKRMLKEQTRLVETAAEEVILKILPVLDNLERALSAAKENHDAENLIKGVEMVDSQVKEILLGEGLEAIVPHGKPFDPEKHEAVMHGESDEHEEDAVIDVMQKGYQYKGKLIRPAMVKVCKKKEPEEECEVETETE